MQTCRRGALALPQHARSVGSGLEYEFDVDTALAKTADGDVLRGFVTNRWSVAGAPNGGMLMAMCISAMRTIQPFRDPLSLTTHFLPPPSLASNGTPARLRAGDSSDAQQLQNEFFPTLHVLGAAKAGSTSLHESLYRWGGIF